ncbi:carbonic anhydrase 5B, mitochondrial-like [Eulemur rufifrons]|uniref:carbonic anhydrase 5B, mitochondrial-like n=1 Tax=Eulemur rufifrons TaxID=859984 RepID=UPI003742930B
MERRATRNWKERHKADGAHRQALNAGARPGRGEAQGACQRWPRAGASGPGSKRRGSGSVGLFWFLHIIWDLIKISSQTMVAMNSLRVILQVSPCKSQWKRFQILRSLPSRSLYICTYKTQNQALHPLWESVDLAPAGDRQSPINIRWRDSVYDPALKPLTISYDPTTCLHVWNNGYSFLMEFEDSTDKSGRPCGIWVI